MGSPSRSLIAFQFCLQILWVHDKVRNWIRREQCKRRCKLLNSITYNLIFTLLAARPPQILMGITT